MGTIATELLETKRDEHGRRITPAAEREALVRAYPESGLTQKAFAKKDNRESVNSGVGSLVGVVAGMVFKIVIGLMMIGWFFVDVFWV